MTARQKKSGPERGLLDEAPGPVERPPRSDLPPSLEAACSHHAAVTPKEDPRTMHLAVEMSTLEPPLTVVVSIGSRRGLPLWHEQA